MSVNAYINVLEKHNKVFGLQEFIDVAQSMVGVRGLLNLLKYKLGYGVW